MPWIKSRYVSRDKRFPSLTHPRWFQSGHIAYLCNLSEAGNCILLCCWVSAAFFGASGQKRCSAPSKAESTGLLDDAEFCWEEKDSGEQLDFELFHQWIALLILAKLVFSTCVWEGRQFLFKWPLCKAKSKAVISLSFASFQISGASPRKK